MRRHWENSILRSEMTIAPQTYYKTKLFKGVLGITLLLSVFNFWGYVGATAYRQQQTIQTELVYSGNPKTARRVISYKIALPPAIKSIGGETSSQYQVLRLAAFNSLIKTKLAAISKQLYSFNTARRFVPLKTIPQSSYEDFLPSVTG